MMAHVFAYIGIYLAFLAIGIYAGAGWAKVRRGWYIDGQPHPDNPVYCLSCGRPHQTGECQRDG